MKEAKRLVFLGCLFLIFTIVSAVSIRFAGANLAASYAFNEASGTAVLDNSSNNNNGVISGATRTTSGKYGRALVFDGINDLVNVSDSNSLDISSAMTLEAWVYPTSSPRGWRTIIAKDSVNDLSYSLYASSKPGNLPSQQVNVQGEQTLQGVSQLPVNTWTFIAATYDGNMQKLYVNGVEVSSRSQTGLITISNGQLHFGGNSIYSEYFAGRIDNVRIYDNALTQTEILNDMNTAVGTLPADAIAPSVSITAPINGSVVSGTISVTADASDNVAVLGVQFLLDGSNLGSEDTVAPYSASFDSSLVSNGQHVLSARARDAAGNNATNTIIVNINNSVTDTIPPILSAGAPSGILTAGTTQTTISLITNENAVCRYSTSQNTDYASMTNTFSTTGTTSHSQLITGLVNGQIYNYYVRCRDTAGNVNTNDYTISFGVDSPSFGRDNTPKTCSQTWGFDCGATCANEADNTYDSCGNCAGSDERLDEVWINATSVVGLQQISAVCQYYTTETTADEMYVYYRNSTTAAWQQKCSGISGGTRSTIRNWTACSFAVDNAVGTHQVRCVIDYDGMSSPCAGGSYFDNDDINFTVVSLVSSPPVRSAGSPSGNLPNGTTQATLSLNTNENAICRYSTIAGVPYSSMTNTFTTTGGTSHSVILNGLADGGSYNYYVRCNNTAGVFNNDDYAIHFGVSSPQNISWPIRISANGKYLEDASGTPFLIVGDAGWDVTTQVSQENAIAYLDNRKAKGFNAVEIRVIGHEVQDNAPNNYYNEAPFTNGPSDWTIRNEAYWARIDSLLTEMKNRGIIVLMFPAYLGWSCGSQGWCQQMIAQSDAVMYDYGQWIGNRYKNYGNIIWMTGGDADASLYGEAANRNAAIVNGIRAVDSDALFSSEPNAGQIGGIDTYTNLVDINSVYTYGTPQSMVQTAYNQNRLFIFQEGYYENEHATSVVDQDAQALITYLGGGSGNIFGSCPLWSFGAAASYCDSSSSPFNSWQNAMNSAGSVSQGAVSRLMNSRSWWTFVPDYSNNVVTSSKGSEMNYHATAREASGKTIMAWAPDTNSITVDMTKISGTEARAWWFNVDDGSAILAGTYATTGTRNFTPSSARKVLVIDDASLNLPAPGIL